jgi:TRAP-type C4-dicarboxylate transport system permease small subunit
MSDEYIASVGRRIERSAACLLFVERYFVGSLMITMTGLYALNIFVRMLLPTYASAFAWIDEAARYMMVWIVFLASGAALEVGRHISVNIAQQYMPPRVLAVVFKIVDVVGFAFSLGAAYLSANLAIFVAGTGQMSPTLGVPAYLLYVAPTVGFLLLAFRYLLRLAGLRDARRKSDRPSWIRNEPT